MIISDSKSSGITKIITISSEQKSWNRNIEIAASYQGLYYSLGLHPHEASKYNKGLEVELIDLIQTNKPVAVGEIGLDFHYNFSKKDEQIAAFERQLRIATDFNLSVIIHSRNAEKDILSALSKSGLSGAGNLRGVIHCYTGNSENAKRFLDLGFLISVTGIITFEKLDKLRAVIKGIPLESLMLETDAPYLAPIPYRGKQNRPAYLVETARRLADLHETSIEEVATITTNNAVKLFGLK